MNALTDRSFQVYERVPEDAPESIPGWCFFFLVDEVSEDVFVPAPFLGQLEMIVYLATGELVIYPNTGPVEQIRERPFVSARTLAEDDDGWEALRLQVLADFRRCANVVDRFD